MLQKEYLGFALPDGPPPPAPATGSRDHVGVHRQRDGRYYVGVAPHVGRTSGSQLWQVADLAEAYGSGRISTTAEQKLLILDVPEPTGSASWSARLRRWTCRSARPRSAGRRWPAPASSSASSRSWRPSSGPATSTPNWTGGCPGSTPRSRINVNGCPNSCARFQVADIGLKGSIVDGGDGFQVHLGGSLGADPAFGRKLRGLKVGADGLTDYVERLLRNYLADRADGEQFATWVRRADDGLLV